VNITARKSDVALIECYQSSFLKQLFNSISCKIVCHLFLQGMVLCGITTDRTQNFSGANIYHPFSKEEENSWQKICK
jgi:hypothetical protein